MVRVEYLVQENVMETCVVLLAHPSSSLKDAFWGQLKQVTELILVQPRWKTQEAQIYFSVKI